MDNSKVKMKILFYSPNSILIEHSFAENILIKELLKKGHQVNRILCDSVFDLCDSMGAFGLSNKSSIGKRKEICSRCNKISKSYKKFPNLNYYDLSNFLFEIDIIKINKYINSLEINTFEFEDDYFISADLKKKAAYLTILNFKMDDLSFNDESFRFFKSKLKAALISFFIGKRVKSVLKVDILLIYSPQYEINNFFYEGYKFQKLKTYFIEGSENLFFHHGGLRIWDWDIHKLVSPMKSNWDKINEKSISSKHNYLVEKHLKINYSSKSHRVFSIAKTGKINFKNSFNLNSFKKTYLLCLSSSDEAFAAFSIGAFPEKKIKSNVFLNQLEWLDYTIKFFSVNMDFGLIVRIHPRETFKNNGISKSQHYNKMVEKFNSIVLTDNIYINYPDDKISIYDLFPVIDVTLISWSLTAIESLLHSKPVIVYDNNLTNYPDEIICTGNTVEQYRFNLEKSKEYNFMANVNLYDLGYNWLKANFYFNNLIFNSKGFGLKFHLFSLRLLRKINNQFMLDLFLFIFYKIIRLNKFSRNRLSELIELKKNDLLSFDSESY